MKAYPPDLEPQFVTVLREGYTRQHFGRDLLAGIVVGIVAFPLAIAFGIASDVRPEQGLATAVVAGFLISLLSGSRVQIGGPTGAFVVLVAGVMSTHGYAGLATATVMAGLLLLLMGLARLGQVIRYVPYPVTIGFTSGIAVVIATGQLRDALGLEIERLPPGFVPELIAYLGAAHTADPVSIALCLATIVVVRLTPRFARRMPGALIAIVLSTLLVRIFELDVATIESRFGAISAALPMPTIPSFEWSAVRELFSPALSIALLAGIESLLSAVVSDGMTGHRHRANAELIALGVANVTTPLFGGLPAVGGLARTATNVKNGAVSPVAGMVHAATLLLLVIFAGKWVGWIPMATLAGVLLTVAYNMSEARMLLRFVKRGPGSDSLVLYTTFLLTVFVDITVAIQVGVVLAALLMMRRLADVTQVRSFAGGSRLDGGGDGQAAPELPAGVDLFEIQGSFCFGAASKFSEVMANTRAMPRVVILRLRDVFAIDATGLHALEEALDRFQRAGVPVLLAELQRGALEVLRRSEVIERLGVDAVHARLSDAIAHAGALAQRVSAGADLR